VQTYERAAYYPRIDIDHESLFVPEMPENFPEDFLSRCARSIRTMNTKYSQKDHAPSAIVVVTHAGSCIGMAAAATGRQIGEINPAPPCGIYALTLSDAVEPAEKTAIWDMDSWEVVDGMNGYAGHISNFSEETFPWNHFGTDGTYSGPPKDYEVKSMPKKKYETINSS